MGIGKINKGIGLSAAMLVFFWNCLEEEHHAFVVFAFATMRHSCSSHCSEQFSLKLVLRSFMSSWRGEIRLTCQAWRVLAVCVCWVYNCMQWADARHGSAKELVHACRRRKKRRACAASRLSEQCSVNRKRDPHCVALIQHSLNSQPLTALECTRSCDLELLCSEDVSCNSDVSLVPDRSDCTADELSS